MSKSPHEDAELAGRIAGVVTRLDYADRLRLLGYAKSLLIVNEPADRRTTRITVQTFDEAVGVCDAYQIGNDFACAVGLMDLFSTGHSVLFAGHDDITDYARGRSWGEAPDGAQPTPGGPGDAK